MSRVGFVSLGCPKALVDSERILTRLRDDGYEIVPTYEAADVVVVNTCGFIESARDESLDAIGEAMSANGKVIVTGCLGVDETLIRRKHPRVLGVTGPHQYEQVVAAVHRVLPPPARHDPFVDLVPPAGIRLTPRHYAYLKISEGCNNRCSFCIIPSMRGRLNSRRIDDVMQEAQRLVDAGVQELLVISQDTGAYGADIRYESALVNGVRLRSDLDGLCEALGSLGVWIRLHYVYPYPHVDRIIPAMVERAVLPYLDVPLQHGSPAVLKRMRRPACTDDTLKRIARWRAQCPDLTLRSTFIVGFPGETESDFDRLIEFLHEAQLDRVGCFIYSPVEGAAANRLDGEVPDEVKQSRWDRFMQVQRDISARRLRRRVGSTLEVLIDEVQGTSARGRGWADAPGIDGTVYVHSDQPLEPGRIVQVQIRQSEDYDLRGVMLSDDAARRG